MLAQLFEDKKKSNDKTSSKKSKGKQKKRKSSSSMHTEEIIARVRAEENKPKPKKLTRRMPEVSFQLKRKNTLATETKSPYKLQPARGGSSLSQPRSNKQYSFKDEHVDLLFKLLNKSNRLKLPEARRPEEVGKTDNPNYCLYHRMLGHPTKSHDIFKDIVHTLIDAGCSSSARSRRK